MAQFAFDQITPSEVPWPKRGRKPKELPEDLIKALHWSFANEKHVHLDMDADQRDTFANLLSKAGRDLNMRIERHVEENTPKIGVVRFHFRARAKVNR